MEMLIYLKSLGRYLNQSPEHIREELVKELRERLHKKERDMNTEDRALELVEDNSNKLGRLIVSDPNAPATLLSRLANSEDKHILERIAEHPRVSPYTLAILAESDHVEVRIAVAENKSTPFSVLNRLAYDDHVDVRFRLAESTHMRLSILAILELDENPYVAMRASRTSEKINREYEKLGAICAA